MACPRMQPGMGKVQRTGFITRDDYLDVEKIDAHFHIHAVDSRPSLQKLPRRVFPNVAVHVSDPVAFRQRHQAAHAEKAHPNRVEVMVAFELRGWDDPDWVERTIQYLGQAKERLKVWKDIGMVFRIVRINLHD